MAEKMEALSVEDMQRELVATQLEAARIELEEKKETNLLHRQRKAQRQREGEARLQNMQQEREKTAQLVRECRHRAGGSPDNMAKGNGMSCLVRYLLPDGVTITIKCQRCPLKVRTPNPDAPQYQGPEGKKLLKKDTEYFNALMEEADKKPFVERPMQGPTFRFRRNGVPFVPVFQ